LITLQRKFRLAESAELQTSAAARMLPDCYRDVYWDSRQGLTSASVLSSQQVEQFRQLYPKAQKIVRDLFEGGVSIHSGSDTPTELIVPGAGLLEELRLLHEAGLTPEQVLEISTRRSALFLGQPRLGTLAEGSPADFVIYEQDPTESLSALTTIHGVVRDGRLYERKVLDRQLRVYQRWFQSPLYSLVTNAIFHIAVNIRRLI
jgi:imidazolonepropionase-like amidohydrolase